MDLVIDFNYLGLILNKLWLFQKAKKKNKQRKIQKFQKNFWEKNPLYNNFSGCRKPTYACLQTSWKYS